MPGSDGTGPRGQGPLTGRGEGHCAVRIPDSGEVPYGYAGLQGTPVRLGTPAVQPALRARFVPWLNPAAWLGRAFRRGRGRGTSRGRGRRSGRW